MKSDSVECHDAIFEKLWFASSYERRFDHSHQKALRFVGYSVQFLRGYTFDHLFDVYLFTTKLATYLQTVRIWRNSGDGNYACGHTLNDHSAEVRMNLKNSYCPWHLFFFIHILVVYHKGNAFFRCELWLCMPQINTLSQHLLTAHGASMIFPLAYALHRSSNPFTKESTTACLPF